MRLSSLLVVVKQRKSFRERSCESDSLLRSYRATLLSGATYCLLKNRNTYIRLVNEIRTRFQKEDDINVQSAGELKYMLAVLDEALRFYPPAPIAIPRVVPAPGEIIEGRWVPGGVSHSLYTRRVLC